MSCGCHQRLAVCVAIFLGTAMLLPPVACVIQVPSSVKVQACKYFTFKWNATEKILAAEWGLKDAVNDKLGTKLIYTDIVPTVNVLPQVSNSAYKGRVSFVGNLTAGHAWFKLSNLSVNDTNTYGTSIRENGETSVFSSARLIVTVTPQFTTFPTSSKTIKEGDDLSIQCSAKGPPTPQVKWLHNGNILSMGHGGFALLNIVNIQRSQSGIYECQASNNPNEEPAKATTKVIVYYKPSISQGSSSNSISSWKGNTITLKCVVSSSFPSPDFTWYRPNRDVIPCNQCSKTVSSQVTVQTGQDSGDYGFYGCLATNMAGSDLHIITVTQLLPPGPPIVTLADLQPSSVIVRWTKPVDNGGSPVSKYKLMIDSKIFVIDAPNTHKPISGLTKGTKYEVKLYANNIAGYGNASIQYFTTKKQGPPSLPEVKADIHQSSITLSWSIPDQNGGEITHYKIYKKEEKDISWSAVASDVTDTTYTVEHLEPGRNYSFLVTASNQYGESLKDDSKAKTVVLSKTKSVVGPTKKAIETKVAVGVLSAFLTVFLLVIILLALYIWRKRSSKLQLNNERTRENLTYNDPVGAGDIALLSTATMNSPPTSQPDLEYESVEFARADVPPHYEKLPLSEIQPHDYQKLNPSTRINTQENSDNRQTIQDSNPYQDLDISSRHDHSAEQTYEHLRRGLK